MSLIPNKILQQYNNISNDDKEDILINQLILYNGVVLCMFHCEIDYDVLNDINLDFNMDNIPENFLKLEDDVNSVYDAIVCI